MAGKFFVYNSGKAVWNSDKILAMYEDNGQFKILVEGQSESITMDRTEYEELVRFLKGL